MGHLINNLSQRVGVARSALPCSAIMSGSGARIRNYAYAPLSSGTLKKCSSFVCGVNARVIDRVFFPATLKIISPRVFFLLFETIAMERFFYSIIYVGLSSRACTPCLIGLLPSHSLTLSESKQDDSVPSISLLTGGQTSGRISFVAGGEEVQR
jgi:hypothetical protein